MSDPNQPLYRSEDRMIAGVIGGFAEHFGVEPTLLRLAAVFVVVATGLVPGIVTYLVAALIMPDGSGHARGERAAETSIR